MNKKYDVIGDVHGEFDRLVALLTAMEYRDHGARRHHAEAEAGDDRMTTLHF